MLTIDEFSRVTRLSIKALRLYHEKGILVPDRLHYQNNNAVRMILIRLERDKGVSGKNRIAGAFGGGCTSLRENGTMLPC